MHINQAEFVPMTDFRSEMVTIHMHAWPSYLDTAKIGVNAKRLERICRVAAMDHLSIVPYSQSPTRAYAEVAGVDSQGGAVATRAREENMPTFETTSRLLYPHLGLREPYRWFASTLRINTTAIEERIRSDPRPEVKLRTPKPWADALDRSIRRGVDQIGTGNLMGELWSRPDMVLEGALPLIWGLGELLHPDRSNAIPIYGAIDPTLKPIVGTIIAGVVVGQVENGLDYLGGSIHHLLGNHDLKFRYSVFRPPIDQVVLLKGLTHINPWRRVVASLE